MIVTDSSELAGLRAAGRAVAQARDAMLAAAEPGVSTAALDRLGAEILRHHGARPAPPTRGFPAATCVSVNDVVAHGIPSEDHLLAPGDLLNVDVSAELDGFWADCGRSIGIGPLDEASARLVHAAAEANAAGLAAAVAGRPLRTVGRAMQRVATTHRLTIIKNLAGHGCGRDLWEEPQVLAYEERDDTRRLREGQVLAIEPFVSTGASVAVEDDDGWTLRTPGRRGAQVEHTIVVTDGAPIVLTAAE